MERSLSRKVYLLLTYFWILNSNDSVYSKDLPPALRNLKCSAKELKTCFIVNGNKAIPLLAKGDPEYGIPKMIPLQIPFMNIISTPNLSMNFTNVEVYGLDKLKIDGFKSDEKEHYYLLDLKGDNVTVIGNYEADGRILVMPLKGKGKFSLFFKNGKFKSQVYVTVIENKGEKYFKPTDSRFQARFGQLIFKLDNLFEGNKQLGDQVNSFLNENWESLMADFGPSVEETVAKIIHDIFGNLAANVPLKSFFA